MTASVAIVILNYNGRTFLNKFLPNVLQHAEGAEVIVADNQSTDDSVAFMQATFPQVRLIINKENGGFAKGYNDALKHVDADYYVLLNSDAEVTAGWLTPIISFMEEHPKVAACQPKIMAYHNRITFEYAGAAGGYIDYLGYPFCRGRLFDTLEEDEHQYDDIRKVFWATGCCMFLRSSTFHEFNGFDEDYFAHMEEIDLCWRMNNAGYEVFYHGESKVYHVGGGTLPKSNPRKTYLNFRNSLITLYKNTRRRHLIQKLCLRSLLDVVAATKFLFFDSRADAMAVYRAQWYFWSRLPKWQSKRKNLKRSNKACLDLILPKSIVLLYYLKGKKSFKDL
ncbi:glycosyltransferase family 2 protein [Persicobacter sp. CCB-QB2]|uniref:glycosyltransferase family 2 protein n=1 Tax=Persicobacter sp. CCB-QB2 TaxID=1561025 RepID=UPI0006A9AEAC|nr:glycosyltransferase family 2 protein [Persicobacter sp. CCB-QB2]